MLGRNQEQGRAVGTGGSSGAGLELENGYASLDTLVSFAPLVQDAVAPCVQFAAYVRPLLGLFWDYASALFIGNHDNHVGSCLRL